MYQWIQIYREFKILAKLLAIIIMATHKGNCKLQRFGVGNFFPITTHLPMHFLDQLLVLELHLPEESDLQSRRFRSMRFQMISRYYRYNIVIIIFSLNKEMLCINMKCNPSFYSVCLRLLLGMRGIP